MDLNFVTWYHVRFSAGFHGARGYIPLQPSLGSRSHQCERPLVKVVGIELGATDRLVTVAQFAPRLAKALQTGRRLAALDVPAAVAAQTWRATTLAQGLYGCELRDIYRSGGGAARPEQLQNRP